MGSIPLDDRGVHLWYIIKLKDYINISREKAMHISLRQGGGRNWHEQSALQSVAVQLIDWQQRKWTAIFTIFFHSVLQFSITIFSHRTALQIKKLIGRKGQNIGQDAFLYPILGPPGGQFEFCRQWGVAEVSECPAKLLFKYMIM